MKYLYIILVSFTFIVGCDEESITPQEQQETPIYGTWKLIQTYGNDGSESKWTDVENGYNYVFKSDGIYTSSRFSMCHSGKYTIEGNKLMLDFECDNFDLDAENYSFEIDNDSLILSPTDIDCNECHYKLIKRRVTDTKIYYPREIKFITVGQATTGTDSILRESPPFNLVVNNRTDWENLIKKQKVNPIDLQETDIDFDKFLVIAIFWKQEGYGHEVAIKKIMEYESNIIVSFSDRTYFTASITRPFHIVKIRKIDKPIEFKHIKWVD